MSSFETLPHEEQLKLLQALAEIAVGLFDLPQGVRPVLINVSENATYRIDIDGRPRFAMRIHRDRYHTKAGIASELAWLQALRRDGAAITPIPVPGRNGELIQTIQGPGFPRPRHIVLSKWESGIEPPEDALFQYFEVLGEVTARMHLHARNWVRPVGFERHTWDYETSLGARPHWGRWRDGMGLDPAKEALFARTADTIERRLERFGKGPERFGLVHCDMRLANLLIDGDITKVIDFDDCGFSYFLYDCATAVSFIEHRPDIPDLLDLWVRGYRLAADLPKEDEAEIPTFVMLRRLLLVAWIGSHSETNLAQSMGVHYTGDTVGLCDRYLTKFG
jgi:Ser/Thr protein kinase RdoA (MazF antagonist)